MAEYYSQALVLPTPEDHQTQITIPVPPASVSLPAVFPTGTETTPQPELLEDDDFVLVEKSSLLLRTPEIPTPVTENANATLPSNCFFKCPGCHTHFHSFSTFVIHIDNGTCSSASMSRQINNEINAFAVQLFRNFSVVSGWTPAFRSRGTIVILMNIYGRNALMLISRTLVYIFLVPLEHKL